MACLRAAGERIPTKKKHYSRTPLARHSHHKTFVLMVCGARHASQSFELFGFYCTQHKCISHISHDYFDFAIFFSNFFVCFNGKSFEKISTKIKTCLTVWIKCFWVMSTGWSMWGEMNNHYLIFLKKINSCSTYFVG